MFLHQSVLKQEAIEGLNIRPDGIYVDCTMGGAGHSEEIASRLNEQGRLIAFDQDDQALKEGKERLKKYGERVVIVKTNFRYMKEQLERLQIDQVDGILFDLGVSSPQLDQAERGFSYQYDSALDMRMDRGQPFTAEMLINEWSEKDIARILHEYGEERFAQRIAKRIVQTRELEPIRTTGQLAEIIKDAIPAATRRTGPHPARRSFQAIRIAVNDELSAFEEALLQSVECLRRDGRLCVITFHSLEDRICKRVLSEMMGRCTCPPDLPVCACGQQAKVEWVYRKPIVPSEREIEINPRARSAKLRIARKMI